MLISSQKRKQKQNTFIAVSRLAFGQMSGNCGLAKLTHKIYHHAAVLELSRYSIGKDSFTKVLVEMHFPVNSKMLDPFSSVFLVPSREHLTELAGKAGVFCGEQGCVPHRGLRVEGVQETGLRSQKQVLHTSLRRDLVWKQGFNSARGRLDQEC